MKTSLFQLERSFVNAQQDYGENAQQTYKAKVDLIDMLLQTAQYEIKINKQQGEKYYQRAIELARPLDMEELITVKYKAFFSYATQLESLHQNKQAYNLLIQLLPLQKTIKIEIIMIQIQVLNHIIENGRLCKIQGIVPLNEQHIQLMESVGLTFYLYKQFDKKFQSIFFQALSFQAKILHRQKKEKEAALLYCQCYHLSNELLGANEERTKTYKRLYEELSERVGVNIKIQDQVEEDETEFNQQIISPRQVYTQPPMLHNYIINVDAVRAPKVIKKVDKTKETKLMSSKTNLQVKEMPQIFIIKNQMKRPQSSQTTTKITSPARGVSFFSKKTSERQQIKIPSLEQSVLKELEDAQPINQIQELIINRPQYETHRRIESAKIRKPTSNNVLLVPSNTQRYQMREQSKNFINLKVDQYNKNQKPSNTPSSQKIERASQKKITNNVGEVLPTLGNIRLQGSAKDLTHDYHEEMIKQEDKQNISFQSEAPITIITPTDPIIAKFLETHSMDILLEAIEKLQRRARNFIYQKHYHQSRVEKGERKIQHSPSRVITSKIINRSNTYGHGMMEIVDIKISENEVSKKIFKIFQSANTMDWYPIHFFDKLFTDFETSKWVLENPRFRGQCLQKYSEKEQFQQINVEMIQQSLSNPKKSAALQVIGSVDISNHTRKIQVRFMIDSLADHYKDVQSYDDMMDLFDQLLNIYLQQEELFNEWLDGFKEKLLYRSSSSKHSATGQRRQSFELTRERKLEYQKNMEYYQYLLSKVLFLLQRKSYIRTMNGYKFKSEPQNQQVSIQNYNNLIYQKKLERIRHYFQSDEIEIQGEENKPILSKKRNRKRTKDRNLFILPLRKQTIIKENTSGDEEIPSMMRDTPFVSLKDTGMIIGSELESKQLIMSETPLMQPPTIKQIGKSNFRNMQPSEPVPDLIEIFSLETQEYLERYFPEFNLNVLADYTPTSLPSIRKPRTVSTYRFKNRNKSEKFEKLEYKPINSENYLILTQIIKIDNQYYYLTLTQKIHLKQIFGKDLWEDSIDIQLKDLINYQVGRTGYIIDLIKLQNILQQKIEIVNTRIQLKPDETDNSHQKKQIKLFRKDPQLYYAIESINFIEEGIKCRSEASESQDGENNETIQEQRIPLIDVVFLLGILNNKYVEYSGPIHNCYLLQQQNGQVFFAQPEQPRKPKFPFRLILSHEDVNKHISRTNEQTIYAKDISLFPHYNSVFLVRQNQYNYKPFGVKLHILSDMKKLHAAIRNELASAQLLIYFNNKKKIKFWLTSEQTEKWAHLFQIDGNMKQHMFHYKTCLKKSLVGYQLYLNENRKTLSKDIRFMLMQNKLINTQEYFVQTSIQQIGKVFVSGIVFQKIILLKIMPAGNKSKQHVFLHPIYDDNAIQLMYTLCKYFVLKATQTYNKLELYPITQNSIRKQYLLSNQYNDNNILIGRKSYSRVVYKQVKKIDKNYFIITVTLIKNYFQLYLYNQSNCRKFYFTIHRSDFLIMNQYFLDSVFPEQPDEVIEQFFKSWKLSEIHKIYTLITRAPETFRNRTQLYIQQLKNTKKQLKRSATSGFTNINSFQRQSTLQLNAEQIIEEKETNECWLFDRLLIRNSNSVFEKKLWMEIIKQISISQNQIILDTYKTLLNELIYCNDRICNFICYIPCHEIQQSFRWQPIRLRIYTYDLFQTIDVPLTYRGKQVQVYKMCKDLWLNYEQSHKIPSNQDIMKVNKRNDTELIQYQLLYKDVFMKHKMLLIAIYFYNDIFHVRICSKTNHIIKKLTITQVELKIPYIRQLLMLNPYEAGRRISSIYHNNFVHASFLNL